MTTKEKSTRHPRVVIVAGAQGVSGTAVSFYCPLLSPLGAELRSPDLSGGESHY
jgi:hypothetical protein